MGERIEYEMTKADLAEIMGAINAARATLLIVLQAGMPESPQEAANRAWCALGQRMGFDGMTVQPTDRGHRFFTAERTAS